MIEFYFLLCWTGIFLIAGVLIWRQVTAHIKVYLILILHLLFLTGTFYFYPLILKMIPKL